MAERIFIKNLGRYKVGDIKDWDQSTWAMFANYDKVTVPVEDVLRAGLQVILNKEKNNERTIPVGKTVRG